MSEAPRVVMDTSTIIGAMLGPKSVPRQAFLVAIRAYELCVSNTTLKELGEVVRRRKFDTYLPLRERLDFLALLATHASLWEVDAASEQAAAGACRDPEDNKFLALTLACRAVALVTSDADLQILNPWHGIPILPPSEFVARMSDL